MPGTQRIASATLQAPVTKTASFNGAGLDVKEYIGEVMVTLDCAVGTGTTPTLIATVEDSANNSTFAAIPGVTAFTTVTDATVGVNNMQAKRIPIDPVRRYIRLVATIAGETPSFAYSGRLIGQKQQQA
jgi:hypothetical protein